MLTSDSLGREKLRTADEGMTAPVDVSPARRFPSPRAGLAKQRQSNHGRSKRRCPGDRRVRLLVNLFNRDDDPQGMAPRKLGSGRMAVRPATFTLERANPPYRKKNRACPRTGGASRGDRHRRALLESGVQEQRRQERLQKIAEKVSDPVYWPSNRVTTLDAKFQLSTKWLPDQTTNGSANYKNGELKYKLNIRGYPKALEEAWRSEFNSSYFITIHLLDKDDFEITSLEITLDQLTRTVNPKGDGIGFSIQGAEKMSLWTYRRIDDWKISWNL